MSAIVPTHERQCAVCTNDFTTPKILPCGHLLCRQCVVSWMDSQPNAGCPLCTCPIVESLGSSVDVVDALPTEHVMEAIVESSHVRVRDAVCTVCNAIRADYICMQCGEKLCPWCTKIHKRMVATRSHDVESVSTVTPERLAASRPALCADHGDKQAELFCVRHNLVICTLCGCNKHGDCPEIRYVEDQMMYAENELGLSKKKLSKAEGNLKQEIGKLNVRIETADATEQEKMAQVDKTCERLQKMVEDGQKQLNKVINESFSKNKNCLHDAKGKLEKRLGKVTSHEHLVTRATTVRPRPALIHAAKTLTDRVNSLDLTNELEAIPWEDPSPKLAKFCDAVCKQIQAELLNMKQQGALIDPPHDSVDTLPSTGFHFVMPQEAFRAKPVLVFHENCGTNIRLTNFRKTARKVELDKYGDSIIMSRDPMAVNVLYEVTIDEINTPAGISLSLGVTSVSPSQLTLPTLADHLKDSVILWQNAVRDKDTDTWTNVTKALKFLKVGSRVGLLVDSSNNLHFYADGQDKGVAAKNVSQPCFAFFNLYDDVNQVTALPTSERT